MADASGTLTLQFGTATYESASWDSTSQTGAGVSVRVDRLQPSVLYTATPVCSGATTGSYGLQTGTPGQMQPRCTTAFPYTVRQLPVGNFESIAATGTLINAGADTALNTVTLTNPIQYFGAMSTSLTVSSNGVLSTIPFTASTATNKSAASTSLPVGTIAPFWDDLTATPGTGVGCYWQAKDPDGTPASGDEYTIVSWEGYKTVSSATGLLNFQVKFFANGNIEYHYGAMNPGTTGAAHQGSGATTWLEDPTGKSALAVNVNSLTPGIAPSSAWRFTYAP
ncbi:MAG: hypothetical protein IPJ65_39155 [Archangiaceae bacterium]|nr:hypothetical protein [Archangiaceae bacterium]